MLELRSWKKTKDRSESATQSRQKYLEKRESANGQSPQAKPHKSKSTGIVADETFWSEDAEKRERIKAENEKEIDDERQFRAQQPPKISEYESMIEQSQRSAFGNTMKFSSDDATERSKLREQRIEWNRQMTAMKELKDGMNDNAEDLMNRLSGYRTEISKLIEEIKAMEPVKSKKGGKSKGKKSKIAAPTTSISMTEDIPKLVEQCQRVEQDVPEWHYGVKTEECNTLLHSFLFKILTESNEQFRDLVGYRETVENLEDALFEQIEGEFIGLYLPLFQQFEIASKWRECGAVHLKLVDAQKRADRLMAESALAKLKMLMTMDERQHNDDERQEDGGDQQEVPEPIELDQVVGYLKAIPFDVDSRTTIAVKERLIKLNEEQTQFISKVEQWVKQKQASSNDPDHVET